MKKLILGFIMISNMVIGGENIKLGFGALEKFTKDEDDQSGNCAVGAGALGALYNGKLNAGFGTMAGALLEDGNNNLYLSTGGKQLKENDTIRIGEPKTHKRCFVAGVHKTEVKEDVRVVVVDKNGQLGTIALDELKKK